jgi:hypothetical protein
MTLRADRGAPYGKPPFDDQKFRHDFKGRFLMFEVYVKHLISVYNLILFSRLKEGAAL